MNSDVLQTAVQVFNAGGIVIFPTDTALGIGCRLDNEQAVQRLFQIRKRPLTQATPVLVASIDMALQYFTSPSNIVRRLMDTYWPGSLTIISTCDSSRIYSPIRGAGNTIGLRMPNHQVLLQIISAIGVPILGPSANFHTLPTPYYQKDLDPELVKLVDFVVPGECTVHAVSTVVDCTQSPYKIIRQGATKIPV